MKQYFQDLFEKIDDFFFDLKPSFFSNLSTVIFGIITALVIYKIYENGTLKDKDLNIDSFKVLIIVLPILVSTLTLLVKFLNNDKERKYKYENEISFLERRKDIKELEKTVNEHFKDLISKNDNLIYLEKIIKTKIENNLESKIISTLENKFKENIEHEYVVTKITETLIPITKNTEIYIDRIQRNSIVNLVIGIIGTVSAISILSITILSSNTYSNLTDFFMHFLPRFTFIIFIQLFAFFFLRLYKNNLEDTKYFQNELSNLTAKSVSIKVALLTKNTDRLNELLKDLSNIERNFKLLKDETLQNLENKKIEKALDENILNQIKDLVSKIEVKK